MAWGLAQGEREIGLQSDVLMLYENGFGYPADRILFNYRPTSLWGRSTGFAIKIKEICRLLRHYEVFHFNFGTTLIDLSSWGLPLLDLPVYKRKGKVVVTYNGCDARQKSRTMQRVAFSACHESNCYDGICNQKGWDQIKEKKISKFDQYADALFAVNPDLFHVLPKRTRFLPYSISNWSGIEAVPYQTPKRRMKIVHAPTNRVAKGSEQILSVLDQINRDYPGRIEVNLVEDLPNARARQIYAEADLAIDQILIGWYGGFAVEVMKMGKPVMAFIRKEDLTLLPEKMARECQEAVINVDPPSLYEQLCAIIENPEILKKYREAALEYVHRWHDPVYIANITKSVYEG